MVTAADCRANCELFGRRAQFWEEAIVPLWTEVYDMLMARVDIREGSTALDLGTGTGEVALRLARAVGPKGNVVGIDEQPEMIRMAKAKATKDSATNIEFKQTSMQSMDLPDSSFDLAVGNYALCCSTDYDAALSECFRVLKPGARLTYNQWGPVRPRAAEIMYDVFEGYKTKTPSESLMEMRRSEKLQIDAVERYLEPAVALGALRKAGFLHPEVMRAKETIRYPSLDDYIDEWLKFDWAVEASEISTARLGEFREKAAKELRTISNGAGFDLEREVAYYAAAKPS